MHGRRREEYKARLLDPKVSAGLSQKAQQWNTLTAKLQRGTMPPTQALELVEKLLLVNPDPLVLWNTRRKLLLLSNNDSNDITIINTIYELDLTTKCLERNPKSYGAWFHRKWILCTYENTNVGILQKQLTLCALLLRNDERNFHCWNYRTLVVGLLLGHSNNGSWCTTEESSSSSSSSSSKESTTITTMGAQIVMSKENKETTSTEQQYDILQAEWDFTTTKIQDNFSNYSAFHYRSKLLLWRVLCHPETSTFSLLLLQQELEMVHNAIFTEPDDQTAWWYHRFLLVEAFAGNVTIEMLQQEQELLMELNQAEDLKSKWVWLGLLVVLQQLQIKGEQTVQTDIQQCLTRLEELDPDRAARYVSLRSDVVTDK